MMRPQGGQESLLAGAGEGLPFQWRDPAREEKEEAAKAGAIRPCLSQASPASQARGRLCGLQMTDEGSSL